MIKISNKKTLLTALFLFVLSLSVVISQKQFNIVNYTTKDDGKIEASYFDAGAEKAVIFAHGAIFNKESWYFLAEKLQEIGISSLCIDFRGYGNSTATNLSNKKLDIIGAITFLKGNGVKEISLIGASMGGAATLSAITDKTEGLVAKMILLAPAGGPPIKSKSIQKLFVVSKNEGLYNQVKTLFNESAEPKTLKVFLGNAHAQHLFKTKYADELLKLCIEFINK